MKKRNFSSIPREQGLDAVPGLIWRRSKSANARGGTPLCDLNGDVRPDRVWFSGCFVLNGVSISLLSVLNRASPHYLMA